MRTLLALLTLSLAAPPVLAAGGQETAPQRIRTAGTDVPAAPAPPSASVLSARTARSHLIGDRPVSIGPDWKAVYSPSGVTFTPALGQRAPRTHTLGLSLLGIERGGRALNDLDLTALSQLKRGSVRYRRSADIEEVYDALPEGLEQSFVFATRPAGEGDLVVRLDLATELPEEQRLAADALRFRAPHVGGVRIDTVVGIDAAGRRTGGALERSGGELHLVLPGAFVDAASYPLVLDPLIGTAPTQLDDASIDNAQVDVASAGAPSGLYGFAHVRYYSATDPDVTLTVANLSGATVTAIETDIGTFDQQPAIAYNRDADSFCIVWERRSAPGVLDGQVHCASYALATGTAQPGILLSPGYDPAVGGDNFPGYPQVRGCGCGDPPAAGNLRLRPANPLRTESTPPTRQAGSRIPRSSSHPIATGARLASHWPSSPGRSAAPGSHRCKGGRLGGVAPLGGPIRVVVASQPL